MANGPPVVRNTLSKKLKFSLIFSSVNQFLHQLDDLKIKIKALKCSYTFTSHSLSHIIDNNQISYKVSSLDVAGKHFQIATGASSQERSLIF